MTGTPTPMPGPDTTESELRRRFTAAAVDVRPSRPAPTAAELRDAALRPERARRGDPARRVRVTISIAVCVVVVAAVGVGVARSRGPGPVPLPAADAGDLLVVLHPDGSVQVVSPETGAVERTVVGAHPVDAAGRRLGRPLSVSVARNTAYVTYDTGDAFGGVIESVPLSGGPLTPVAEGLAGTVDPSGTELAFWRLTSPSGGSNLDSAVSVEDLRSRVVRNVYSVAGFGVVSTLSWSTDGGELALSGVFPGPSSSLADTQIGVEVLRLSMPTGADNPAVVHVRTFGAGSEPTWSDAQFIGDGRVVAVSSEPGNGCEPAPTTVYASDPATGVSTEVAHFSFDVPDVIVDPTGQLIAVLRSRIPAACSTTTTTTSNRSGSTSVFLEAPSQFTLDRWSAGVSTPLAGNVVAVALDSGGVSH